MPHWMRLLLFALSSASLQAQILPDLVETHDLSSAYYKFESYGNALAIDCDTIAVGRASQNNATGDVQLHFRGHGDWSQSYFLTLSNGTHVSALALQGNRLVVGAAGVDGAGIVHVFEGGGSNWTEVAVLKASDRNPNADREERFGETAALDGDTLIVAAPRKNTDSDPITTEGALYVFEWNGSTWMETQTITTPDASPSFGLGSHMVLENGTLVVSGIPQHSLDGARPVYVFIHNGTQWVQQQRLFSAGSHPYEEFGASLSLQGDRLAIGTGRPDTAVNGAAYIFEREDSTWLQRARLTSDDASIFGRQVLLNGRSLVVTDDNNLHYYNLEGDAWVGAPTTPFLVGCCTWPRTIVREGDTIAVSFENQNEFYDYARVYTTNYTDSSAVTQAVGKMLYTANAEEEGYLAADQAAFRYKSLLYDEDAGANGKIRPRFEMMDEWYGPAERARLTTARAILQKGLQVNPASPELGHAILDLYYDQAVAESILAKSAAGNAARARFGPPIAPPPGPSGFLVDNEILLYREIVATNRFALETYLSLLTDDLGKANDPPLGYTLFRDFVPGRALMAATYDNEGVPEPVTEDTMLFSGYKDLALAFDLLQEDGRCVSHLVELLIGRNDPDDWEEAGALLIGAQRRLLIQGNMLTGIFTALPSPTDPSGLAASLAGWKASLTHMAELDQVLRGEINPLGFAPDFLMLVENFNESGLQLFHSFDALAARISTNSLNPILRSAQGKLEDARTSYADFRGFEDQLAAQFQDSTITYRDRLRDIVGVFPDDPGYGDDPTDHPGSELDQQYRSMEVARLRIRRNAAEISNLNARVQIELSRVAALSNAVIEFGNKQAAISETIAHINATQAAADALADGLALENLLSGRSIGIVVNAAVQAGAEEWKGQLEADKERLAATEQAVLAGIDSAAFIKSMLLEMNTLVIDTEEAVLLLQQEVARLAGLYREKRDLEARLEAANVMRAGRYFADPIHRLAANADMLAANFAFNEARRWLFFTLRAFEYKWNLPFQDFEYPEGSGKVWSHDTLFRLRNADELADFFDALVELDARINRGSVDRFDWFSVRRDFMNLKDLDDQGLPAVYTDPVTGLELDALSMFRTNLLRRLDGSGNNQWFDLEFSTVRQIPGGFFFVGPIFNESGGVESKGRFLDKIDYLQIRLPGNHTLGRPQLAGNLTYGGVSFIRNFNVGTFDPERPDRLRDEMTPYSTRYWFYDPTPGQMRWRFTEGLTIENVEMELSEDPRIPPSVTRIEEFKERSVAATGWKLRVPTISLGQQVLRISELNDVEIYFHHRSAPRQ